MRNVIFYIRSCIPWFKLFLLTTLGFCLIKRHFCFRNEVNHLDTSSPQSMPDTLKIQNLNIEALKWLRSQNSPWNTKILLLCYLSRRTYLAPHIRGWKIKMFIASVDMWSGSTNSGISSFYRETKQNNTLVFMGVWNQDMMILGAAPSGEAYVTLYI